MRTPSFRRFVCLTAIAFSGAFTADLQAQSGTWNVAGGGSWTNTANWVSGIVATNTDNTADFTTKDITANAVVTLDLNRTIGNLRFADTTTASHDWFLVTNNANVTLLLDVSSGIPVINVTNRTLTIGATITGTKGYAKGGAGTLILTNLGNTITGPVLVTNGLLEITTSGRIGGTGVGSGDVTLNGGTFQNDDTGAGNALLTVNRSFIIGANGGTFSLANAAQILLCSNVVSGPGILTKSGPGEIRVYGPTNSNSKLIINGGTFTIGQSSFIGGDWSYGATNATPVADALNILNGATNRIAGGADVTLHTNRGVTLGAGGGVFRVSDGRNMTIPSIITGAGYLRKEGSNTLTLSANNTYSGGTTNNAGILGVTVGGSAGTLRYTVAIRGGSMLLSQTGDSLGYGSGTCVTNLFLETGSLIHQPNNNLSLWGETITMTAGTLSATNSGGSAAIDFGNGTVINTVASASSSTIGGTRVRLRQTTTTFNVPRGTAASDLNITAPMIIAEVNPAGLTKAGTGILTLSGANTYNGPTTVSGGTLALSGSGSVASSSSLTFASGTTLDVSTISAGYSLAANQVMTANGNVTVNGNLTVPATARVIPGGSNAIGVLTCNNSLTLAGTALTFDLTPATNDLLVVGGNLNLSGVNIINLNGAPAPGNYTIIRYTGALVGAPAGLQLNSTRATLDFSIPGEVHVIYTGAPANLTWRGDGSGNAWDTGTSVDWWNGAALDNFYNGDTVTFDDSSTNQTVTLAGTPNPATAVVNSASNYVFSGAINLTNTLTKSGTGTLKLQSYTGSSATSTNDLVINQGTVDFSTGYFNASPFGFRALQITVNSGGSLRTSAGHALGGDNIDGGTSFGQVSILGGFFDVSGSQYISGGGANNLGRLVLQGGSVGGSADLRTDPGTVISTLPAAASSSITNAGGLSLQYGAVGFDVSDGTAAYDLVVGTVLSSGFGIVKSNLGTLLLTTTNTYTGATAINAGTLALGAAASISNCPTINIASGATFDVSAVSGGFTLNTNQTVTGSGAVAGNVTVVTNSLLTPGSGTTAGTLTFSNNLALTGGSALNFNLAPNAATPGLNDLIAVGGNLSLTATSAVNILLLSSALDTTTPYALITYAGALTGGATNLTLAGLGGLTNRYTFSLDDTVTNVIRLIVSGNPAALVWQGTNGSTWDVSTTTNWLNGTLADKFNPLDTVSFDDTSATQFVALAGTITPAVATVNSTMNYIFAGGGKLSGSVALTKSGTGTLTVSNANDFTGGTVVNGGTFKVGNAAALGISAGTVVATNGGQVDLAGITIGSRAYNYTIAGAGPGGSGAITNSTTTSLAANAGIKNLTLVGDATVGGSGRYDLGYDNSTFGVINGNGFRLTKVGANDVDMRGTTTSLAELIINGGRVYQENFDDALGSLITVNNGSSVGIYGPRTNNAPVSLNGGSTIYNAGNGTNVWNGPITLNANSYFDSSTLGITVPGTIGGLSGFSKIGSGILTLSANNTYAGDTTLTNGFLTLATNYALGTGRLVIGIAGNTTTTTRVNFNDGVNVTNALIVNGGTPTSGLGYFTGPGGTGTATLSGPITITLGAPAGGHFNGGNMVGGLVVTGPINTSPTTTGVSQRVNKMTVSGGGNYASWTLNDLLVLGANNGLCTTSLLNMAASQAGTFDMNGFNQTIGALTNTSTTANNATIVNSNLTSDSTLTLSGGTSNFYTGLIKDGAVRKVALTLSSGALNLTNLNSTFSGDININGGALLSSGNNNVNPVVNSPLGVANLTSRTINVNGGGTLGFLADNTLGNGFANPVVRLAINGGTVSNLNTFTTFGPVVFNNGGTLAANGGNSAVNQAYLLRGGVTVTGSVPASVTSIGANAGVNLFGPTVFDVADVTASPVADFTVGAPLVNQSGGQGSAPGSLTKIGAGTMLLTATNVHGGSTLINAGTLALGPNGSISNSALVNVASGATFDVSAVTGGFAVSAAQTLGGSGTVRGDVATVTGGGNVAPGGLGSIGTLAFANNLVVNSNAALTFDLASTTTVGGGVNDFFIVTNNLTLSPTSTVVLAPSPLAVGTYSLINYQGALAGGVANTLLLNQTRAVASLDDTTPNWIKLNVSAPSTNANLVWLGGDPAGLTTWSSATTNWNNSGVPDRFYSLDAVLFDDNGASNAPVNFVGALQPGSVSVNSSSNYVFTGAGKITGATGLTTGGTGTNFLSNTNDFTGLVTVAGGVLSVSNLALNGSASALGAGPDVQLSGGTLQYTGPNLAGAGFNRRFTLAGPGGAIDQSGSGTFMFLTNTIAGPATASLTKTGAKQLILGEVVGGVPVSGNNPYDGITYINAGEIQIRHPNALGSLIGKTVVNPGGVLSAGGGWTNTVLENIDLSGDGPTGVGALQANDANTAVNFAGNITLVANASLGGGTSFAIGGPIGGTGRLAKYGGNTVTLLGTNTYSGGTFITNGTLQLDNNTALSSLGSGAVTLGSNASLTIYRSDTYTLTNAVSGFGQIKVRGTNGLLLDSSAPINISSILNVGQDSYGKLVVPAGATAAVGSFWLGNPSNIPGDVVQTGGSVIVGGDLRVGHWPGETSSFLLGGGTLSLTNVPTGTVNPSGSTEQPGVLYIGVDGTGIFTQTGGVASANAIVLDGRGNTTGNDTFTLNGGTFIVGANGIVSGSTGANWTYVINLGGGTLAASGAWSSPLLMSLTGVNGNPTLDTAGGNITLSGSLSGPGGLNKINANTLTLSGNSSFSGPVTVSAGLLSVGNNNALGSPLGGTTIGGGAELRWGGGTFTLAEPLSLNGNGSGSGAMHGTGSSSATWNGPVTLAGSTTIKMDGNATFAINGNVTGSGTSLTVTTDGSGNSAINGAISLGAGSFSKTSTAKVTLSNAANSWTGNTLVTGGTLALTGTSGLAGSPTILLSSGAVLDVSGRADTALTVGPGQTFMGGRPGTAANDVLGSLSSGGTINIGSNGVAATLTVTNGLTLTGGTLNYDLAPVTTTGGGVNDLIAAGGAVNLSGVTTIEVNPLNGPLANGSYTLISASAIASGSAANFVAGASVSNLCRSATFSLTPASVVMTISGSAAQVVWAGTNGSNWDLNNTTNWLNSGSPDKFLTFDNVLFDDSSTNGNVVVSGTQNPSSVIVTNSLLNYLISGGSIAGQGGLSKDGLAQLTLANSNTYRGPTLVSAGTLNLAGSLNGGGLLTVVSNATLSGTGSNAGPVVLSGIVSPGTSVGVLSSGPMTWSGGGAYKWEMSGATGTAGINWDLLTINGGINLQATNTNTFAIRLTSLNGVMPGAVTNFDNNSSYTWTMASTTGTVTNYDPASFTLDSAGFSNDLAGGYFFLTSGSLLLSFTNNHTPTVAPLTLSRNPGVTLVKIAFSDLATNWSDADGDPVTLVSTSATSTNGGTVTSDGTYLYLQGPAVASDAFSYVVKDVRTNPPSVYRAGDTQRTNTGTVVVLLSNPGGGGQSQNIGAITTLPDGNKSIAFYGIPGETYWVQAATNLVSPVWQTLSTNAAGGNGFWLFTDLEATNYPARYYRSYHP